MISYQYQQYKYMQLIVLKYEALKFSYYCFKIFLVQGIVSLAKLKDGLEVYVILR